MTIRSWRATFFAFFGLALLLAGVPLVAREQQVGFQRIAERHGLTQGGIHCMLQDRLGFMWFGTAEGLVRFDGYRFKVYRHDKTDPHAISGNTVYALHEDEDGMLWLGTAGGGLCRFDPGLEQATTFRREGGVAESGLTVVGLLPTGDGEFWLATWGDGLQRFNPQTGGAAIYRHHPDQPNSLPGNSLHTLLRDSRGRLWVGGKSGLALFRPETNDFQRFVHDPQSADSLSHNNVKHLVEDRRGNLWIATYGGGLNRLNPDSGKVEQVYRRRPDDPHGLTEDKIWVICPDGYDRFWLGSGNGGLHYFDAAKGTMLRYRHRAGDADSVSDDNILSLMVDRTGNLWVGGYGGGIDLLTAASRRFSRYAHRPDNPNSLINDNVTALVQDPFGDLWIGTRAGLSRYRDSRQTYTHFRHRAADRLSLSSDEVTCLTAGATGVVWVGTRDAGLNRFNRAEGTFTRFPASEQGLSHAYVRTLFEDQLGNFWVGTWGGGLNRFDRKTGRATVYRSREGDSSSLSFDEVSTVLEDREGRLWVGTFQGLNHMDRKTGRFHRISHDPERLDSLSHNRVVALLEDSQSRLWVGTPGGLNRLRQYDPDFPERASWQTSAYADGMMSIDVRAMLEDEAGFLWVATNKGLSKLDPETMTWRHWRPLDGAQPRGYNVAAAARKLSGELCFGGFGGVSGFLPGDLVDDPYAPEIVLTDLLILNQSVKPRVVQPGSPLNVPLRQTEHLDFGYRDRVISFEFAALHYGNPSQNRYRYQLEGFDKDWVEVGADKRFVTYTELDPGRYTLRVSAANPDGKWTDRPRVVALRMRPPPWRSWWAYALYFLVFGVLVYAYLRVQRGKLAYERGRVQHLQQVDLMKNQVLATTADQLRAPLDGMIGLAESFSDSLRRRQIEAPLDQLVLIAQSGRRLRQLVDDILDYTRLAANTFQLYPRRVQLPAVARMVVTLLEAGARDKGLVLHQQVPETLPDAAADEYRLQQILFNLIGNAVNHTQQGSITLSAEVQGAWLRVSVTDTGVGLAPEQSETMRRALASEEMLRLPGAGLGLAVAHALVRRHGGKLCLASSPGRGSTFSFTLPCADASTPTRAAEPEARAALGLPLPLHEGDTLAGVRAVTADEATAFLSAGQFTILIVDDEQVNRQVLVNHLSNRDYQTLEAGDGAEALALLERHHEIDLVLLDVVLPQQSGFEVCRQIRARRVLQDLPVIFLTAKNQVDDLVEGFKAGGNDYITKPIVKNELLSRVKTHLQLLDVARSLERQLADQTKQAAENKALVTDLCAELAAFERLLKVINRQDVMARVLQMVLAQGVELFEGAAQGALLLPTPTRDRFGFVAALGRDLTELRDHSTAAADVCHWLTEDVETLAAGVYWKRHFNLLHDPGLFGAQALPKSMMVLELKPGESLEGYLLFENTEDAEAFAGVDPAQATRFRELVMAAVAKCALVARLQSSHDELAQTRRQLVLQDKKASLGSLAAGMADEIQNPLNFINNFAGLTLDLVTALSEQLEAREGEALSGDLLAGLREDLHDLRENAVVIEKHGRRADSIVSSMSALSRTSGARRHEANLNKFIDEYVSLTYQSLRTRDPGLVIQFERDFDESVGKVGLVPQSLSRVFINLTDNAAESIAEKRGLIGEGFVGEIRLQTRNLAEGIEIRFRDNGVGVPRDDFDRVFEPFFTTKSSEPGHVGLGLSMCRDIVVNEHGGTIKLSATKDIFAEVIITLPLRVSLSPRRRRFLRRLPSNARRRAVRRAWLVRRGFGNCGRHVMLG